MLTSGKHECHLGVVGEGLNSRVYHGWTSMNRMNPNCHKRKMSPKHFVFRFRVRLKFRRPLRLWLLKFAIWPSPISNLSDESFRKQLSIIIAVWIFISSFLQRTRRKINCESATAFYQISAKSVDRSSVAKVAILTMDNNS